MRLTFAVLLTMACACQPTVMSGGIEVYASIWERTDQELRYRAAMELQCAAPDIGLTLIQRQGKFPILVHAEGCGLQALYSRDLRRSKGQYTDRNSTWIVESKGPARD